MKEMFGEQVKKNKVRDGAKGIIFFSDKEKCSRGIKSILSLNSDQIKVYNLHCRKICVFSFSYSLTP